MRPSKKHNENNQVISYAIHIPKHIKKKKLFHMRPSKKHIRKEMTCHKVTNLRTEA